MKKKRRGGKRLLDCTGASYCAHSRVYDSSALNMHRKQRMRVSGVKSARSNSGGKDAMAQP